MRTSEKTLLVFAVYLVGAGAALVLLPNLLLGLIGLPPSTEAWPRVVGLLAWLLAFYYFQAARAGLTAFTRWTVIGRLGAGLGLAALVLAGQAGPGLLLLGGTDIAAALWTAWALRREAQPAAQHPSPARV